MRGPVTVDNAVAGDTPSPFINDHLSICLSGVGSKSGVSLLQFFFFLLFWVTSSGVHNACNEVFTNVINSAFYIMSSILIL